MSAPTVDLSTQIAQIQARITDVTAQMAADTTTDGESAALGSYLTQLTQALDTLVGVTKKARKPFRVTNTHPRW